MGSTFSGLEVAKRALTTQQAALYTTGHNIANANTPGYTRQRVNFVQTAPYPTPSLNRPQIPGQMGTGVEAGSIQRIRDSFVDDQYRSETNKLGYWSTRNQALASLETIMNEPTEEGLANSLDQFWNALEDLSVTPQDSGVRSVVRQRGMALAETINFMDSNLKTVREDYKAEIEVSQKAINSLLSQINNVNQQIAQNEVHGYLPNDLYDERDRLVDDLSNYININIEKKSSGGLSNADAEGGYDVFLANKSGQTMTDDDGKPIKLVDFSGKQAYGISLSYDEEHSDNPVSGMQFFTLNADGAVDSDSQLAYQFSSFQTFKDGSTGSFTAMVEAYGFTSDKGVTGIYTDMISNLDQLAFTFANRFNEVHQSGWSISEINKGAKEGKDFFAFDSKVATPTMTDPAGAAASLRVSDDIKTSLDNIAAAAGSTEEENAEAFIGNGSNAVKLANVKDDILSYGSSSTSVMGFYQSVIGDMGVKALESKRMAGNTEVLRESALTRRESISSVSLDEEMTNMIKYQHAYNAAARNITMIDEMLDRIINNMGVVGR